jgi:hypothetical protein
MNLISATSISFARRVIFYVSCLFLPFVFAFETHAAPATDDLVSFFKQALVLPPDVESFVGSARTLRLPAGLPGFALNVTNLSRVSFYEGARAGTNFFLRKITGPNAAPKPAPSELVAGRAGSNIYQLNSNLVTYSFGKTRIQEGVSDSFTLLSEFLSMGLINVEPKSVIWNGDHLTALDTRTGNQVFGELQLSNGLPSSLTIRKQERSRPYNVFVYSYPDPPRSRGGYPSKILVLNADGPGQEPTPLTEFEIVSLRLAAQPLSEEFFDSSRFKGSNIIHTNVFSNSVMFASTKAGKMLEVPTKEVPRDVLRRRKFVIFFVCLVILAAGPIIIFGVAKKSQHQKNNTN